MERRLARDVGTERIPVAGERAGADFAAGPFVYQAKLGRRFPTYLRNWLAGIAAKGQQTGRVGVLVWKPKYAPDAEALVCLRWTDWCHLHGAPTPDAVERRTENPVRAWNPLADMAFHGALPECLP